jgi:hypothetical protein
MRLVAVIIVLAAMSACRPAPAAEDYAVARSKFQTHSSREEPLHRGERARIRRRAHM